MSQELIFAPLGAMALLTFIVLGFIPATRFRAVFARQVTPDDFKLGESERVPPHVAVTNRNFMNLLELPMLFYVAGLMYYVAGRVDQPRWSWPGPTWACAPSIPRSTSATTTWSTAWWPMPSPTSY